LVVAAVAVVLLYEHGVRERPSEKPPEVPPVVVTGKPFVTPFFESARFFPAVSTHTATNEFLSSRGVVVSHHLLASDLIAKALAALASNHYDRIVLIGPNHYEIGHAPVVTSARVWSTPAGMVMPDQSTMEKLLSTLPHVVAPHERALDGEHSVGAVVPFLAHYFPGVPVIPLAVSLRASREDIAALSEMLVRTDTGKTLYVGSIDFSHYLLPQEAAQRDAHTRHLITTWDVDGLWPLSSQYLDSPRSLVLLMSTMRALGQERVLIYEHKQSDDFLYNYTGEITTYFSLVFTPPHLDLD
jgi:MEMO1 family protein